MLKRNPSAETDANSEKKDQNLFVSQHSSKPTVSGIPFCLNKNWFKFFTVIYFQSLNIFYCNFWFAGVV